MKKRAYFNKQTQGIKYFNRAQALALDKEIWEFIPKIDNFINKDGKHQMRLHFDDFTVDLIETDESIDAEETNKSIISDVEVVANGQPNTN